MKYLSLMIMILTANVGIAAELSGEYIYKRDCIACHGADGAAQTALGKQLKPHPARDLRPKILSVADMRNIIAHGLDKTGMHGHAQRLDPDEIDRLIEYILQFDYQASPNHGRQIFASFCSRCHGMNASGRSSLMAPNLLHSELSDIDMARIIRDGHHGTIMGGFKYELGNDSIADMIVWIKLLRYGLDYNRHEGNNRQ